MGKTPRIEGLNERAWQILSEMRSQSSLSDSIQGVVLVGQYIPPKEYSNIDYTIFMDMSHKMSPEEMRQSADAMHNFDERMNLLEDRFDMPVRRIGIFLAPRPQQRECWYSADRITMIESLIQSYYSSMSRFSGLGDEERRQLGFDSLPKNYLLSPNHIIWNAKDPLECHLATGLIAQTIEKLNRYEERTASGRSIELEHCI